MYVEVPSSNNCYRGKVISITYSEYESVALGMRHAISMRHILICGLSGFVIFFSTLSHKRHDFRKKKVLLNTNVVLILSTNPSETLFILRTAERDMIKKVYWYTCKVPVVLFRY